MKTTLEHRTKAFAQVSFKAAGEDDGVGGKLAEGEFIAIAAVFGNVDRYGEVMVKGAFTETLAAWAASGDPIPVIWQHSWSDPFAHIGFVKSIEENELGLVYRGVIDMDDPFSAKVYKLLKGRRVTQQSFGFDVLDAAEVTVDGVSVYEIRKVELFEVGPCLQGVNNATQLLDVKSSRADAASAAPAEPSGQVEEPPAADDPPSVEPSSVSDESSASKAFAHPASVLLALEIEILEGEIQNG